MRLFSILAVLPATLSAEPLTYPESKRTDFTYELHGTTIPRGALVFVVIASANRDERASFRATPVGRDSIWRVARSTPTR